MLIKILGIGECKNCKVLEKNTKKAVEELGIDAVIEKVRDLQEIMEYGVISTPSLVIDGQVKSVGKVLKPKDIIKLLK